MELSQGRIRQGWGLGTPQCFQRQSAEDQALGPSRLPEVEWGWGEGNPRCIPLNSGGSFPSQTDTVEVRVSLQVWETFIPLAAPQGNRPQPDPTSPHSRYPTPNVLPHCSGVPLFHLGVKAPHQPPVSALAVSLFWLCPLKDKRFHFDDSKLPIVVSFVSCAFGHIREIIA